MAGSILYKGSDLQFTACSLDPSAKGEQSEDGCQEGASRGREQVSEVRSSTAVRERSGGNQRAHAGPGKEHLASRE